MNQDNLTQSMIELRSPMVVYRPVLKAKISIVSDDLDEMSVFSRFNLWMIGKKTSVNLIQEVTQIDRNIIMEEINYLNDIGLVDEHADGTFILTALGEEIYRRINVIESFNKEEHEILIDCVTGNLIPFQGDLLDENEVKDQKAIIKDKIVRELYQNLDPANSREFLFSSYDFSELSIEEREAVHLEVKVYGRISYEPVLVFSVPEICHSEELLTGSLARIEDIPLENRNKEIMSGVSVVYPFLPFVLKITHKELNHYRPAINTLEKIHELDPDLLGEKALRLLQMRDKEKVLLESFPKLYLNQISGAIVKQLPKDAVPYTEERRSDLILFPQYSLSDFNLNQWKDVVHQFIGDYLEEGEWEIDQTVDHVQSMTVWTIASTIFQ